MAAEMEAAGVDAEAIEAFRQASEEEEDEPVLVWPVNSQAFRVFTQCRWTRLPLQTAEGIRLVFDSIASAEVAHVCDLLCVPAAARAQVLEGVRYAESVALPVLNR